MLNSLPRIGLSVFQYNFPKRALTVLVGEGVRLPLEQPVYVMARATDPVYQTLTALVEVPSLMGIGVMPLCGFFEEDGVLVAKAIWLCRSGDAVPLLQDRDVAEKLKRGFDVPEGSEDDLFRHLQAYDVFVMGGEGGPVPQTGRRTLVSYFEGGV